MHSTLVLVFSQLVVPLAAFALPCASPQHCSVVLLPRRCSQISCEVDELDELTAKPASAAVNSPLADVAAGGAVFLLLHTLSISASQVFFGATAGVPSGTDAAARLVATAGFVGVQQLAGFRPVSTWLRIEPSSGAAPAALLTAQPVLVTSALAAAGFALLALLVGLGLSLGDLNALDTVLPAARALPGPGATFDLLLSAPLTEELFFRGYLLTALEGPLGLLASPMLFAAWHLGAALDGPLFFGLLGAWLVALFRASGGSLPLVIGTHSFFNALILLLRAARM
jgi:hypothetical protein